MEERYCMYLRKSRQDEDRQQGESIEDTLARHKKTLEELAQKQSLHVVKVFQEVVSGDSIDARPQMLQMLKEVRQGEWRGCIVMEVERLARGNTKDQGIVAEAFKHSETLIVTPNKTYDPSNEFDEEYFEFHLYMSRRELKTITRRLQGGRLRSVKDGKFCGNVPPYGYERIPVENGKGYTLKAVPEEAKVVKDIFKWYTTGLLQEDGTMERLGTALIARRLNNLKVPKRTLNRKKSSKVTDDVWVQVSIRDILINPHYVGKVRWNWRKAKPNGVDEEGKKKIKRPRAKSDEWIVCEGLHEGIIEPEVFAMAQELMSNNPPRPIGEKGKVMNPLQGLVICGKCGRNMVRRPYGKKNYPDTLMCQMPECKNVSSHLELVEKKILEGLKDKLDDYKLEWQTENKPKKTTNTAIEQIRKAQIKLDNEIEELKQQLLNVYTLFERGKYTEELFDKRVPEIERDIKQAEDDRMALEATLLNEEKREVVLKLAVPTIERILDVYHALPTPKAKNDLLREVLEKVEYTKDKGGRWGNPDEFTVKLYPKLPLTLKR